MAVFMLITALVSWALPDIWRPSTGVLLLSLAQPPSQEARIICPFYKPPFRPVFLKSQELHVRARNLTSARQIFASRSMLYSHREGSWQELWPAVYGVAHCYMLWKTGHLKISQNLSQTVDTNLVCLKFPSLNCLFHNHSLLNRAFVQINGFVFVRYFNATGRIAIVMLPRERIIIS